MQFQVKGNGVAQLIATEAGEFAGYAEEIRLVRGADGNYEGSVLAAVKAKEEKK